MITHFKQCSICHEDKDAVKDFYGDVSCNGGKSTICKGCHRRMNNKRIKNKERDFINNPELIIELCTK